MQVPSRSTDSVQRSALWQVMAPLRRLPSVIPFSKRLLLIIWPFLAIVALLVLLAYVTMDMLSSIRAFVGGESLWSNAQKEAVYHLMNYAESHSEADFIKFRTAIRVPLGDRRAREELEKPQPNFSAVREGFTEGGVHPNDIPGMIRLFRQFRHISDIAHAIALWTEGDSYIDQLDKAGDELRRHIASGQTQPESLAPLLAKIRVTNDRLTPLEHAFSYALGEASRKAHFLLLATTLMISAILVILGIYLSRHMLHQFEVFERALRLSEERFRLAVTGSSDGLWDWNLLTDEVFRSPRFKELLGYADHELANQRIAFVSLLHPDDRDATLAAVEAHLEHNAPYDLECRLQTKSGEYRWFRIRGQAVRNQEGNAIRIAGAITDITDQKRAEEKLIQSHERLEQKVAERTLELTEANERLRDLDQIKTQFFANVSHELRTPLTLIIGPVRRLITDSRSDQEELRDLEVIERNALLLLRHVNDLLDIAKLEAGKMEIRYVKADLANITRFAASHFEMLAKDRQTQFVLDLPASLPAEVDTEKIQRILLNLLSNAFKFNPLGGVVAITLKGEDERAQLSISDSGPGIPLTSRRAVFERFRQIEGDTSRTSSGTGLGLSIVKEFIELHGGTVEIGETPSGGALFTLEIPLIAPEGHAIGENTDVLGRELGRQFIEELRPATRSYKEAEITSAPSTALVLVVEDNADMNAFIAGTLARYYRVITAFDGQQGLEKAIAMRPNIIVSDVMMPRLSGEQLLHALRNHRELSNVPVVLLTARTDDELRVKALKAGAQDYLHKPFLPEELLVRVGRLIDEQQRNEASIRQAHALLHTVTHEITDPIFVKDFDGRYVMMNPAGANLVGRAIGDIIGCTDEQLFPATVARKVKEFDQKLMTDGATVTYEETAVIADAERTFLITKAPCRDYNGQVIGIIGIARDITERKLSEENIRQLNAELEQHVAQRTAQLEFALQELEAFSYSVSHDLRAPLRHITAYSSMLQTASAESLPDTSQRYLATILRCAKQMNELISNLLEFSRVSRVEIRRRRISMDNLVSEVLQELQESNCGTSAQWEIAQLPDVLGDRAMIKQVWSNLLSNAVKYTSRCDNATIRVGYKNSGDKELEFFVKDNGAGFDMQYADKLFGVFQRLHKAEDFEGTGIGLANVRRIVSRHGGRTWAEGKVNEGATFYFTMPPAVG